jgi:hypothetical protein
MHGATLLIGIDDTDTLQSPGTGRLSQRLIAELRQARLGRAVGATRHQLLVDARIPYTSHNSTACIAWEATDPAQGTHVIEYCSAFLERESAPGSDPGLAVALLEALPGSASRDRLTAFGVRAKRDLLSQQIALAVARAVGVHLSGHGGTNGGIIGALAAVGLHLSGDDGLFLWMPGIRELSGEATYGDLRELVPIDAALDPEGAEPPAGETIELGDWVRPVLRDGRAILLLEEALSRNGSRRWRVAPRDVVKQH